MRKKITSILLVLAAVMSLTACGKFTCDLCGQQKTGKQYHEEVFGQKITFCKDCKEGIEAINSLFN